jgi:GAF domain-containing protein
LLERVQLQPGTAETNEPPECVAPIRNRDGKQLGLVLLGPRLSEEPYCGEDRRLLASVASQTATALDNIRLAEEIAARIESRAADITRNGNRPRRAGAPSAASAAAPEHAGMRGPVHSGTRRRRRLL